MSDMSKAEGTSKRRGPIVISRGFFRKPIQVFLSDSIKDQEVTVIRSAMEVFSKVSRPLMGKYVRDIEWIMAVSLNDLCGEWASSDYRSFQYGWKRYLDVQIRIKEDLKKIPVRYRAFGHTEYIYLGGPENPGISITKFPQLFGATETGFGVNGFVPVPALSKIFS